MKQVRSASAYISPWGVLNVSFNLQVYQTFWSTAPRKPILYIDYLPSSCVLTETLGFESARELFRGIYLPSNHHHP